MPTLQPPAHGTLKLIAFGLENCDSELSEFCAARGGGHNVTVPRHVLLAALARKGERRVNLLLDTRCFPNGASTERRPRHPGTHPNNISEIVNHRNFRKFLQRTAEPEWRKAHEQQRAAGRVEEDFVVAAFCKSGKHRSVAIAECLCYIGVSEGFKLKDRVRYLSEPAWRRMCKGNFDECLSDRDGLRRKSLQLALNIWRRC